MYSAKSTLHKAFGIDVAAHGDLSGTNLDQYVSFQVIALGLSSTRTTSLQAALKRLGFGPLHQGFDLFRSPARTQAFIDLDQKLIPNMEGWRPAFRWEVVEVDARLPLNN